MNECDPKLLEALRAMAADGPREAPACVEERLVSAFRRRSRLRRRGLPVAIAAASIAAGITVIVRLRPAPPNPVVAHPATAATKVEVPAAPMVVAQPASVVARKAPSVRRTHRRGAEVALNFYRLPGADELPPMESATVVRVQLPMSSLRLIGLPVNEDRAAESIQADMLLGQDGLPRGVRFVQ